MITNKFFHLFAATVAVFLICAVVTVHAAFIRGNDGSNVLIGRDDDNTENETIQPPDFPFPDFANQSLNNADVINGRGGNDIVIGLLGNDVLSGGRGWDITIGGTEQGTQPNSDIIFGNRGNDVNIWAPGDGSDAYIGGPGRDALIFGVIDRDPTNNVPILSPVSSGPHETTGLPTANVSGAGGFCTLERVDDPDFGFPFLVRFFVRATGDIAVTIRVNGVEQVFCTSEAGGAITFANLEDDDPQFVEVSLEEVGQLNGTVAQIIR